MVVTLILLEDEFVKVLRDLFSCRVCKSKGYMDFEEYSDIHFYKAEKFLYDHLVEKVGEPPAGVNIPFEAFIGEDEDSFVAPGQMFVELWININDDNALFYKDSDAWICALADMPYFVDDEEEEYYLDLGQSEQDRYKYDSWNHVFAEEPEECDVARFWEFRMEDILGFAIRVGPEDTGEYGDFFGGSVVGSIDEYDEDDEESDDEFNDEFEGEDDDYEDEDDDEDDDYDDDDESDDSYR